ncbi:MAG TPA: cell division protein FtsQ/DivIB [Hyphomicrobiales bacterium]|nr:cell division protein FtsQ/DivIB [Hyphomicrobiales bacterium]
MARRDDVMRASSRGGRGASPQQQGTRDNTRRLAGFGRVLLAVLGLSITALAGIGIKQAVDKVNEQKIETVAIEGELNFVSEDAIKDSVLRFVATSLVSIDLAVLKQELEAQPWIHQVAIRREWPGRLIIKVEEEVAIARWGSGALLNQQGGTFTPHSIDGMQQLPHLSGPPGREKEVMGQYLEFNQLLYPLGVRIRDLTMNERSAWTLTLTNGVMVRLGREHVLERLRRLVVFLELLGPERIGDVAAIDLRYRNGIAVEHVTAADDEDGRLVAR